MLNRYPLWKNFLIVAVVALGFLYSAANLYAPDPAVQISGTSSALEIDTATVQKATAALVKNNISFFGETHTNNNALIRLNDQDDQLRAKQLIKNALGDDYIVALNLAPTTPDWLGGLGATPMKLGLDLSGGVHFLMEVDTNSVVTARIKTVEDLAKSELRQARIRYSSVVATKDNRIVARFATEDARNQAASVLRREYRQFIFTSEEGDNNFILEGEMLEQEIATLEANAVNQNLTTLRNRVNELGVSEPIVQRQGRNRIVVELPGVQDTAEAKRIIGKTANLEFRLEAEASALSSNKEEFEFRDSDGGFTRTAFLERRAVITGDNVTGAQASFDSQTSQPQVNIDLSSDGGNKMFRATVKNVGRSLGVLFIEYKTKTQDAQGNVLEKPIQVVEKKLSVWQQFKVH